MAQQQLPAFQRPGTVGVLGYGATLGGLLGAVRLYPLSNVLSMPAVGANQVLPDVPLLEPQNYADVWFTAGRFREEQDFTEQGALYKQQVTLSVPRAAPDVGAALAYLTGLRYFLAVVQDHNQVTRLVGSTDWPLQLTVAHDSGQALRDPNSYQLQLTASAPASAPYYKHIELLPPGRRVFSAGFTFGFQRT